MGENLPVIGEVVDFVGYDGDVSLATVIAVTFWDLVDLRLAGGTILVGVRRVAYADRGDGVILELPSLGRFARLDP